MEHLLEKLTGKQRAMSLAFLPAVWMVIQRVVLLKVMTMEMNSAHLTAHQLGNL